MNNKLSLSIMCADPLNYGQALREIENARADFIHADVMDGNFVENITLGIDQIAAFSESSCVPVEVHLMVSDIGGILPAVLKTGCTHVSFPIEETAFPARHIGVIHAAGKKAGIAVNPATPVDFLETVADCLDYVLVMTVEPGFAGQKFISGCAPKIRRVRRIIGPDKDIIVDGNISPANAALCAEQGANVFVLGTSGAYVSQHVDSGLMERVREAVGSIPRKG